VVVAQASERLATIALNPALSCCRSATVGPLERAGSDHAAGSAATTSLIEKAIAAGAPASMATRPASPGPSRLATLKVIASSALARPRSSPPRTSGSCEVQPPAIAGLTRPAATPRR
jgi:hypothetical protein